MWTPRFGYIWVSGYSWGYLPFQCGAWNYYDSFGWGWAPGMGGCMPWWGTGYLGPNIGFAYGGYRPPFPPRQHPHAPIARGTRTEAYPLVAVTRHPATPGSELPMRDRAGTVVIAGRSVQAIRPLNPRPAYDHSASVFANRTVYPGANSGMRTAGGQTHPAGSGFGTSSQGTSSSSTAARPSGASSHAASTASHGYSGGGSSAGHSSSGGGFSGGGGASHAGGGGGSAGGGSHR